MNMAENAAPQRSILQSLAIYLDRRVLVMLALGFSAGLPLLLIFDTLSAWLREAGLSLSVIGFFGLVTLIYSFKFLWAPLVDRTVVPGLTRVLGHRRSWMLVAQLAVIAGLWLIALSNPAESIAVVAVFAVLTGFASATQDIVIDAWRIEAAEETRQGAMAAAYQWGYRVAMIVAGAVPLILADAYSWSISYAVMAALMAVGMAAVLLAPKERAPVRRPLPDNDIPIRPLAESLEWIGRLGVLVVAAVLVGSGLSGNASVLTMLLAESAADTFQSIWGGAYSAWMQLFVVCFGFVLIVTAAWPLRHVETRPGFYLSHALGAPLGEFFSRFGRTAGLILALICLYRVSDFVLNIMNPFYIDLGFSLTEIAEVRKIFGVVMIMLGVFAAGIAIARWGLMASLIVGAFAGPVSNLVFAWLATQGADITALYIAIGVDNIASGYAGTCLIAYMSSLTSIGFTATQYALFSSLYGLPGRLIASLSGRIVEGAAQSAEAGGIFSPLMIFFRNLPDGALSAGAANAGVSPQALGAGYAVFFLYSFLIGLAAIVLTFVVAARARDESKSTVQDSPASSIGR